MPKYHIVVHNKEKDEMREATVEVENIFAVASNMKQQGWRVTSCTKIKK
jgi:hypothetical protein